MKCKASGEHGGRGHLCSETKRSWKRYKFFIHQCVSSDSSRERAESQQGRWRNPDEERGGGAFTDCKRKSWQWNTSGIASTNTGSPRKGLKAAPHSRFSYPKPNESQKYHGDGGQVGCRNRGGVDREAEMDPGAAESRSWDCCTCNGVSQLLWTLLHILSTGCKYSQPTHLFTARSSPNAKTTTPKAPPILESGDSGQLTTQPPVIMLDGHQD